MRTSRNICITVAVLLAAAALGADWHQWHGPNRDGKSPDTGLLKSWPEKGPPLLWKCSEIGIGYSSPIIVGDTIYITGDTGHPDKPVLWLVALTLDGQVKWKVEHGEGWIGKRSPGSQGSVIYDYDEKRLYLLSSHGLLKCYDAKKGKEKWAVDIFKEFDGHKPGWGYSEMPLVYDKYVIVSPGGQTGFVALKKSNGKVAWKCPEPKEHPGHSSSILVEFEGVPMAVRLSGKAMVACDVRDGTFLWSYDRAVNGAACSTPVHADGLLFGATAYGNGGGCIRLKMVDGKVAYDQVWETKEFENHHGGFVIHEGYLYGNHLAGWTCFELKTGKKMWYEAGIGKGTLCYADGMLYLYGEGGGRMELIEASPKGYKPHGQLRVQGKHRSWPHPVVINGVLYVRYYDTLYAFDVKKK